MKFATLLGLFFSAAIPIAGSAQSREYIDVSLDSLPYPPSTLIKSVTIDTARLSIGHGDNWAITWTDDDRQYSFFTDGKGFGAHPKDVSISPTMIEGVPPHIKGYDIPSETGTLPFLDGGNTSAKVCGLVMIEEVLYAWVRNFNPPGEPLGTGSTMMHSDDYGKTWEYVDWNWPTIGYPTWLNAGQNYTAAEDGYAYFIAPDGPSAYADYENMLMGRVAIEHILDKDRYTFYTGRDPDNPQWGNYEDRTAVFYDGKGCFRPDIIYNPGLDRYFMSMASPFGEWMWWANDNPDRFPHFSMFEAPNPWGPWSTVIYKKDWGAPENRFSPHIPPKWISGDGQSFYLLYSCIPNGPYRFNIQQCTMELYDRQPSK